MNLPVSRVVNVTILTSPIFPARRGFGLLLILGSSATLPLHERSREYAGIDEVAADFSTTSEEYIAANVFFQQSPNPHVLRIGRRFIVATNGEMYGGASPTKTLATWTAITTGSFKIGMDAVAPVNVTAISFAAAGNLNAVASIIQTAVRAANAGFAAATVIYDGTRFIIRSGTTGVASTVTFASPTGSGVDISAMLAATAATGARVTTGSAIEDMPTALQKQQDYNTEWYGVVATKETSDSDIQALATWVNSRIKIGGYTTSNPAAYDSTSTTDLGYLLFNAGIRRVIGMFDDNDPYAIVSAIARAFAVDFNANNSTITLKFKTLPGETPTTLTTTQANALDAKNINYYERFGDSAMFAESTMADGTFFDEVHGLDWLQNAVETNVFGFLYTRTTKVPQTDRGMVLIRQQIEAACKEGVNNGLLAPGKWTGDEFGTLHTGDYLKTGYYVYNGSVDDQNQSDREARLAPPFQVAAKGAGAIHGVNITISFNR
jgi:hypothetical protein